jgi:hypothetical protein
LVELTFPVALGAVKLAQEIQAPFLKIDTDEQRQAVLLLVASHIKVSVHLHPVPVSLTT